MKPIIFSTEMVRAILEGRKSQTRRVIKPQPRCYGKSLACPCNKSKNFIYDKMAEALYCGSCGNLIEYSPENTNYSKQHNPKYLPGDILWVREKWSPDCQHCFASLDEYGYCADCTLNTNNQCISRKRPSIHMPRAAARIFLKVTGVRVERVNDITDDDVLREGLSGTYDIESNIYKSGGYNFMSLWNEIHGAGAWERNDWVWVYDFKRVFLDANN